MNVEEVLEERGAVYGDMLVTHQRIADVWSGIIGAHVTAHDVALCMVGLKLVRASCAPGHMDSYLDAEGYTHIARTIASSWNEQDG